MLPKKGISLHPIVFGDEPHDPLFTEAVQHPDQDQLAGGIGGEKINAGTALSNRKIRVENLEARLERREAGEERRKVPLSIRFHRWMGGTGPPLPFGRLKDADDLAEASKGFIHTIAARAGRNKRARGSRLVGFSPSYDGDASLFGRFQ